MTQFVSRMEKYRPNNELVEINEEATTFIPNYGVT
jgi:hypothetical protein